MGKFQINDTEALKKVEHPLIKNREFYIPESYRFYNNLAEKDKWQRTRVWLGRVIDTIYIRLHRDIVLDAFAGAGVLSAFYLLHGYQVIAIEKNPALALALKENVKSFIAPAAIFEEDNMGVLTLFENNDPRIKIIDLDPYGSCLPQIKEAARIIKSGFLFITCGDIYAGSRFKNWSFTKNRYGIEFSGPAKDYPVKVIYPFIQKEFQKRDKSTQLLDYFSFPTICRLFIAVS
ncbi:MAG: RsmD family RNA methyltransferase [Candidatus Nealsonbacteria bacterium]|nr:RsmD family RNA methyltransferase [Candidatus Nealsonbacteria bacterium]